MTTEIPTDDASPASEFLAVLSYPAQLSSLTTLAALSLSMLVTLAPVVGLVVLLIIWAAALHYAAEVLQRSANGSRTAPEFATEPDGIGWSLLILQALFAACLFWLNLRVESPAWRWLGILAIASLQPAMLLTTVMNRNVGAAIEPARVAGVIAGLGATYPLLIVVSIALGGAQHMLAGWIAQLPAMIGQPLSGFVLFYGMVMYFHLLGRMAFAHHAALGFDPVPETVLRAENRHAPLLDRVERLVTDGEAAQAARELGRCLASEPHATEAMHARYRELLAQTGDVEAMQAHSRERLAQLTAAGADREALNVLREALARDPRFHPFAAAQAMQLAQSAERYGQQDLALALLRDFATRYPRDPEGPLSALKASQLLVERHSDFAGACEVLQAAIAGYPDHPDHDQLRQRLAEIDRLASQLSSNAMNVPPPQR